MMAMAGPAGPAFYLIDMAVMQIQIAVPEFRGRQRPRLSQRFLHSFMA